MKQLLTLTLCVLTVSSLFAQSGEAKEENPAGEIFTSVQSLSVDGKSMEFHTETGTLPLRDEQDDVIALFGFTHYKKMHGEKNRPIVFAFNG